MNWSSHVWSMAEPLLHCMVNGTSYLTLFSDDDDSQIQSLLCDCIRNWVPNPTFLRFSTRLIGNIGCGSVSTVDAHLSLEVVSFERVAKFCDSLCPWVFHVSLQCRWNLILFRSSAFEGKFKQVTKAEVYEERETWMSGIAVRVRQGIHFET